MILYDVETIPEMQGGGEDVDSQQLSEAIKQLTDSVQTLDKTIKDSQTEEEVEVETEQPTEEATEVPEEEKPLQKKDMIELNQNVSKLSDSVDKLVDYQEKESEAKKVEDEKSAMRSESSLTFLDETVDTHLYLTSEVENASLDDVYTMTLSIRNVLVLGFLIALSLFFFKLVRTVIERVMNR